MKAIAAAAVAALIKIGKDCVDSFLEAEKATAKLTGAIAATGQAGNISVKAIEALASALQKTTIYSDEATVSAAAMLQQLGGLTERGLKMAIPVVQDLAAAMGMDLETAATLVGKAIAGNTGALSRYGIEVKEGATKSETFTNVLKGLNEKFGGMAEQLGKTTGGQLVIFRNEIDDLKESLGGLIAQGLNPFLASINRYFSVKSLLAIDPSTITSVSQLQAALKILRDRYAELSVVAAGHGTGLVRPGELAELQNKIEGFSRAIVKLGEAAKEAKGNKDTVIANVGGEADVAALAKLNQSLDDMGNRWKAVGQAFAVAKWEQGLKDMANRWYALGQAVKVTEGIVEDFTDKQRKYQSAWDLYTAAAIRDEALKAAAVKQKTAEIAATRDAELAAEKARLDKFTSLTISSFKEIFESTAIALVQETLTWKSFGETVLKVLGKIISAMGDELAASAAADLIKAIAALASVVGALAAPGFFASAAIKAAGAAAAWISGAALGAIKLAQGGEFTVPPGYENDSFPMRVQSGERVSVIPAGESGGEMIHNTLILDGAVLADWYTRASRNRQILTTARSVIP
jgi:hypothetical protein